MSRMTNALLAVIALCLVLITAKLYDVSVISTAQAATKNPTAATSNAKAPEQVVLTGQRYDRMGEFRLPVVVDRDGVLLVRMAAP